MLIVDRFEGQKAILETATGMKEVWRSELPADVQEGDILLEAADGGYEVDKMATEFRRQKLAKHTHHLENLS